MKKTSQSQENDKDSSILSMQFHEAYTHSDQQFFAERLKNWAAITNAIERTAILLFYIKNNNIDAITQCLTNIDPLTLNQSVLNFTPLTLALSLGHTNICNLLLTQQGIDTSQPDTSGHLPLTLACEIPNAQLVIEILKNPRVDINQGDEDYVSPLTRAIFKKQWDNVDILLSSKQLIPSKHSEALNWAIRHQNIALVKRLIQRGFSCTQTTPKGIITPHNDSEISEVFEEAGKLPLFWAMSTQSLEMYALITSHGGTIKDCDTYNEPLVMSILKYENICQFYDRNHSKSSPIIKPSPSASPTSSKFSFFPAGAAQTLQPDSLISRCISRIQSKDVQGLTALLDKVDGTEMMVDERGNSLLHYAVLVPDNTEILKVLTLKGSCDINALNQQKQTPLLAALAQPFCSLNNLEYLIENGADITHQDEFNGALHYAIQHESLAAIELLLNYNADPNSTSPSGCKAIDLAFKTSLTAYKLIENKKNEMLNNQQAVLGLGILEGYLTSFGEILSKNKDWTPLLILMDDVASHQDIFSRYIASTSDKELAPILKVIKNIIDLVPVEIATSFAKLGILTQEELSWHYRSLCLSYFRYLITQATAENLDFALCSAAKILKNPNIILASPKKEPQDNHSGQDPIEKYINNQIEILQSKKADWSQKILANNLILRWRMHLKSENVAKQKQSGADFDQAVSIYKDLFAKSSNYPQKIGLLITMLEWSPNDTALQINYAKTVLNSHNPKFLKKAFERMGGTGQFQEAKAKEYLKNIAESDKSALAVK